MMVFALMGRRVQVAVMGFSTLVATVVFMLGTPVGSAIATIRIQKFAVSARSQDGSVDVQAGSHPYSLTTRVCSESL